MSDLATAFSPLDPEFVRDPYPIFAALRDHDRVHRSHLGHWVLTRYDDVVAAMRDPRLSNRPSRYAVVHARNAGKYAAARVANNILPFLDPPEHTLPRRGIATAFREQLASAPPDVAAIAAELLAPHRARGELDALADFATPLSVAVIARLLGVPRADERRLEEWSSWFFYLFSVIPSQEVLDGLNRALDAFRAYMLAQSADRRARPGDDLVSRLVTAGLGLSDDALADTCMLLFADGVENVDAGITNAALTILRTPGLRDRLRADPAALPAAADECLRLEAPGQFIAKIATRDFELHGRPIRAHDAVLLVLGAANRDPRAFDEPDAFRLDRDGPRHLAFGKGRHACIGAPLVMLEMQAALAALLALDDLTLATPEPEWQPRLGHRWLARLPLSFRSDAQR